jgi:phosphatidylinositol alpha-mannosyltransferase
VLALAGFALQKIGVHRIGQALASVRIPWLIASLALMCSSMALRAESWYAILSAALRGSRAHRPEMARGVAIGVFASATLPGRVGEPIRALIVSRRLGDTRRWFPTVLGTVLSQSLLNLGALFVLALVAFAQLPLLQQHATALILAAVVPASIAGMLVVAPRLIRGIRWARVPLLQTVSAAVANRLAEARSGLLVFRYPWRALHASSAQGAAWALQVLACYVLFVAFGFQHRIGLSAAAAVLLAVNVTAILPPTPSNVGIFQAACVVVLALEGIGKGDALAYGIVLQLVEVATAVGLGLPALVQEGLSWREIRATAAEIKASSAELGPP